MTQSPFERPQGRGHQEPRSLVITPNFSLHAEGSVLVEAGNTRVICTASVEHKAPSFLLGTGKGWVTAEYGMLPRATHTRSSREASSGRQGGRTLEIQRLIGRSLRSVVNLSALGERTITLDCDVIQADGGTRTAAISGGFVALVLALRKLAQTQPFDHPPVTHYLAAISVGLLVGNPLLDLEYVEDSKAEVDLNVVMTDSLELVEVQGTAESRPFTRPQLNSLLDLAEIGIKRWIHVQKEALGGHLV